MSNQQKCMQCGTPLGGTAEIRICSCCKAVHIVETTAGVESLRLMNKNVYFSGATWPNIYLLIAIVLVAIFTGGYFAMLLMTITLLAVQNKMYIDGEDIVFIPFFGGKIRHIKATELQNARWKLSQCSITYGNGSKFIFIPNAIGARKKITMLLANRTTDVSPEVVQES